MSWKKFWDWNYRMMFTEEGQEPAIQFYAHGDKKEGIDEMRFEAFGNKFFYVEEHRQKPRRQIEEDEVEVIDYPKRKLLR